MYTNIKNLYNKGGVKKYNTQGILGPSPYGANIMPQGLYPSESIVYSQGSENVQDAAQQNLNLATQHLEDLEDFNYEQELLSSQLEKSNRSSGLFNQALNLGQRKLGISPNWRAGFTMPTDKFTGFDMIPGENYGQFTYNTPSINTPVDNVADYLTSTPATAGETAASIGDTINIHGQDLSTQIQPREITGINTDMNMVPITESGGSLLMPSEFNPTNTAMAGTAASLIGDAWRNFSDDDDPTTLKPGEIGGTLVGSAGRGAGVASVLGSLAPALAVPGLGWAAAGIGALVGGLSAWKRRRDARRDERKRKRQYNKAVKAQRNAYLNAGKAGIMGRTYTGQDTGRSIVDAGANRTGYLKLGGMPYKYV